MTFECEVHHKCKNEADLWIHLNGKAKRSCSGCSARAIRDGQVVEAHWDAPLDKPAPSAEHRALTPVERATIIEAEDRAHGQAIPLPPPVEESPPRLPAADSPPTADPPEEPDMGSKVLTLTLRPDADAHPELCRVAECLSGDKPPKRLIRGLCEHDYKVVHHAKRLEEFALPSVNAPKKARGVIMPLTASAPDVVLSEGDALLPHGAAAQPVTVQADPPPAPPPPAVEGSATDVLCDELDVVRLERDQWRELADVSGDALEAVAEAMRLKHDREAPIGPQLVARATSLFQRNALLEFERAEARRERDEAKAALDRSQNELLALASEVKHLTGRAERAESLVAETDKLRQRGADGLQAYADLRAKLCEALGEDSSEFTDQGILDAVTMDRVWWKRTAADFEAFRLAVAQLVDVEDEMATAESTDYLLDNLRAALVTPASYGPFRVDSAVYIPNGRGQATLTWAHGEKVLAPVGSMVNLTVVGVGRG